MGKVKSEEKRFSNDGEYVSRKVGKSLAEKATEAKMTFWEDQSQSLTFTSQHIGVVRFFF